MLIIKLILYRSSGLSEKLESPSLLSDLKGKSKKLMQALIVVTQMFFDNAKYFEFVSKMGIMVPIIPGIKPLAVQRHLQILPQIFRIDCLKI
jgi:methylenetetrahydrofolate reductase (NADPH)